MWLFTPSDKLNDTLHFLSQKFKELFSLNIPINLEVWLEIEKSPTATLIKLAQRSDYLHFMT